MPHPSKPEPEPDHPIGDDIHIGDEERLGDEERFAERLAQLDASLSSSIADGSASSPATDRDHRHDANPENDDEMDAALRQAADVLEMMHRVRQFEGQSLSGLGAAAAKDTASQRADSTPVYGVQDSSHRDLSDGEPGTRDSDPNASGANGSSEASNVPAPNMIGRFQIVRLLGAGGFGLVYLAIDSKLDRRVAIKVPRPEALASADTAKRFLREGKAAAALNHPNIVPVYEAGEIGTVAYIASAYCPGSTLAEWLDRNGKPISPRAAAAIVARLCDAAEHAHRRGVLHRDLKPANILLELPEPAEDPPPQAWSISEFELAACARINDFGLARLDNTNLETQTTSALGTPSYMPPEQADPTSGEVGPASDVYSLGAILYQLLTGRPPFREATILATLDAVRHRLPVSPRRIEAEIPADLEAITLKCLEKSSHHRYDSAAALADDLERFLDDRPVRARRIHSGERLARWCRKNPLVAALACAVVLLAIGSTVTSIRLAISRSETREALESAVSANRQASLSEYRAQVALAGSMQNSSTSGQRVESLDAVARAAVLARELGIDSQVQLRNLAIAALSTSDVTLDRQWPVKVVGESFLTTSPDCESYVHVDDQNRHLVSRRIDDNSVNGRYEFETAAQRVIGMRFSADGSRLGARYALGRGRERMQIWNVSDHQSIANCEIGGFGRAAEFSSDGARVAMIAADNRTIEIRKLPKFTLENSIKRETQIQTLAFSPDANSVAVHREGIIELLDIRRNEVWLELDCPSFPYSLEFSPDGSQLVAACRDTRVRVYPIVRGRKSKRVAATSLLEGHAAMVVTTSWHPSEPLIATCSMDGKSRLWDLRGSRTLLELDAKCTGFSRDGRWLGIEGGRMAVNLTKSKRSFQQRDSKINLPIDLGFYPRGNVTSEIDYWVAMPNRQLMIGQNYFRAVFRDATTDDALADISVPGCWFRFSDDGRSLYASSQIAGFCRLPIQEIEDEDSITLKMGPPQVVHPARGGAFALAGERCVITPFLTTGYVLGLNTESLGATNVLSNLAVHPYTFWSDLSPDGRLAASGAMKAPNVRVFDAESGKRIKTLPSQTSAPWFSPDGKRLVVAENARYTIYDVDTWESLKRIETVAGGIWPGSLAFSPDGQLLALEMGSEIHLISSDDFSSIARFGVPSGELIESIGFSGDGRFLFSGGGDQDRTHRWDLAKIRIELRNLDLDWDAAESLPSLTPIKPLRLELDLGPIADTTQRPTLWPN